MLLTQFVSPGAVLLIKSGSADQAKEAMSKAYIQYLYMKCAFFMRWDFFFRFHQYSQAWNLF